MNTGIQVAESCPHGGYKTHIADGGPFKRYRIIKEMMLEVYPGHTIPKKHNRIAPFRVRSVRSKFLLRPRTQIIPGRSPLQWQHLLPPGINLFVLGEKRWPPMSMRFPP